MSGIMPRYGVVAGSPLVAGGVSVAPETESTACPVRYHKNGCSPVDDREAWNYWIASIVNALNSVDMEYDCTDPDQFRAMICAIAVACAPGTPTTPEVVCRSALTGTYPPTTQVADIIVDDTTNPVTTLCVWNCTTGAYDCLTIASNCCDPNYGGGEVGTGQPVEVGTYVDGTSSEIVWDLGDTLGGKFELRVADLRPVLNDSVQMYFDYSRNAGGTWTNFFTVAPTALAPWEGGDFLMWSAGSRMQWRELIGNFNGDVLGAMAGGDRIRIRCETNGFGGPEPRAMTARLLCIFRHC